MLKNRAFAPDSSGMLLATMLATLSLVSVVSFQWMAALRTEEPAEALLV